MTNYDFFTDSVCKRRTVTKFKETQYVYNDGKLVTKFQVSKNRKPKKESILVDRKKHVLYLQKIRKIK